MNILFICVANSIRSQMAEGIARNILGKGFNIYSAGINSSFVHPMAVKVMAEINIDISKQTSKSISTIDLSKIDRAITLCKNEICPSPFAKIEHEHWPLPNPANFGDTEVSQLEQFRKVRDLLIEKINDLKGRGLTPCTCRT